MSWEGYEQVICTNGHLRRKNAEMWGIGYGDGWICSCGAPIAWWNQVDTTNDDGEEYVIDSEINTSEVFCNCPDCGNRHITKEVTYKIPKNKGHRVTKKDRQKYLQLREAERLQYG